MTKHEVYFHGNLAKLYGNTPITIYGNNLRDIFLKLKATFGTKFYNIIKNGHYNITRGERRINSNFILERDKLVNQNEIEIDFKEKDIHIFPVLAGAGKFGQIITGVVLIIVGIIVSIFNPVIGGYLIWAGVLTIVSGVIGLIIGAIAGDPTKQRDTEVAQNPSFLYNGVVNTVEQGGPVPVTYGLHMQGSTVVSANIVNLANSSEGNVIPQNDSEFNTSPVNWTNDNTTYFIEDGHIKVITNGIALSNIYYDITSYVQKAGDYMVSVSCLVFSPNTFSKIVIEDDSQIYAQSDNYDSNIFGNITVIFTRYDSVPIVGTLKLRLVVDGINDSRSYFDNVRLTYLY